MNDRHYQLRRARYIGALVAVALLIHKPAASATLMCAPTDVRPDYPLLDAPPTVQATHDANRAATYSGAACFGETQSHSTWVTVAAVVRTSLDQRAMIERLGAISQLRAAWYWSTTDQAWRPLVSAAYAIESPSATKPRADYSSAEIVAGTSLVYSVADSRSDTAVNYSMQLTSNTAGHLVVDTANIGPVKKWGITLYQPRSVRTLYFLTELSPSVWSYYSITRAVPATFLANGHEKSIINRAAALFRHYMGLPATSDPPPAP